MKRSLNNGLGGDDSWQLRGSASRACSSPTFAANVGFRKTAVVNASDISNTGTSNPRANPLRDYHPSSPERTLARFIDTSAFAFPAIYTYVNAGRNSVEGPGQVNFDFSVFKNFRLNADARGHFRPDEIQFRAEFFNVLNTPQFFIPNRTFGVPQFGSITDVVNNSRQIQFALKFIF